MTNRTTWYFDIRHKPPYYRDSPAAVSHRYHAFGEYLHSAAPNPLRIAEIGDTLLDSATPCDAAAPLAQLAEQLTLNQLEGGFSSGENTCSQESAAPGAALDVAIDPQLQVVVQNWPGLSEEIRSGIVAMVRATDQ